MVTQDVRSFIGNDNIKDRDMLILMARLCDTSSGPARLTYLGYLNLLKPHFNHELARDLLLRDTITRGMAQPAEGDRLQEMQEAVLLLLNELLLLHCICIAEHEDLKAAFMDEYMLNSLEIAEILGFSETGSPLKAIAEFIDCNSSYEIEESEVKFLLSFLQTKEHCLPQEKYLNWLFVPTRGVNAMARTEAKAQSEKEKEQLHANYGKTYLGKSDLLTNGRKLTYLNYIHPSSYDELHQQPLSQRQPRLPTQEPVAEEHHRLSVFDDKFMKKSMQQLKKPPSSQTLNDRPLDESVIESSNLYRSKLPSRHAPHSLHPHPASLPSSQHLQHSDYRPLETPILEQFMHESNIGRNMGQSRQSRTHNRYELNTLIEESSNSNSKSDAFQVVDHTTPTPKPLISVKPPNYRPEAHHYPSRPDSYRPEGHDYPSRPDSYRPSHPPPADYPRQSHPNSSKVGSLAGSGILNQFIRSDR